nr:exosortase H-associated membrane protein [uncultured Acidovorax sp.]
MRLNSMGRFLLVAVLSLLCLMPLWYYLAPQLAAPVFYMAGEVMSSVFQWALSYTRQEATGVLKTTLKVVSAHNGQFRTGQLAPAVDYRLLGYGIVILWALLLASFPRGWGRKLLLGSLAMLPIQAINVIVQWCNDALNRAGAEVFAQTGLPGWMADVVAFLYHFNLFIFTALAPVMLWLLLDRAFLANLHAQAKAAMAVHQAR